MPALAQPTSVETMPIAAPPAEPPAPPEPEERRAQDDRNLFVPADPTATTFAALAAATSDSVDNASTSRWAGVLGGAAYHVEVPAQWNGKLVMYAHGYVPGDGNTLVITDPSIRRHLIQNGYAWAASSYSKNFYDVRVGVEDTNALALEFNKIAKANGRELAAPSKIYITGHSMGGHVAAAAIEDEVYATANHKVRYDGAVPMCGVVGDTELFDYFAGAQVTAQALAGLPKYPTMNWSDIESQVRATLFNDFRALPLPNIATTAIGDKYASVIENLTGGPRPMFDLGFKSGGSFTAVWTVFGGDGTIDGILNGSVLDTYRFVYSIEDDLAGTAAINSSVIKLKPTPEANRLRRDGLRWIPKVNGQFKIPVVTLHTLGDLYVPFSMEQIYNRRVAANGNSDWLVQRAVRGISHCDFTQAEQIEAFDAMIKWERDGVKPEGDDVLTAATVAGVAYGCKFTRPPSGAVDEVPLIAFSRGIAASVEPCPS